MKYLIACFALVFVFGFAPVADTYTVSLEDSKMTWTGKRVTYGHYGSMDFKSGTLEVDGNTLTGGSFVVDMTSIRDLDIDDEQRSGRLVNHLKSDDFFDVAKYPESSFVITKAEKKKTDTGNYMITGNLTVRGKTNEESFAATVNIKSNEVQASGKLVFDRTKYDVRYGSGSFFDDLGDKMIHDNIEVEVELVARK